MTRAITFLIAYAACDVLAAIVFNINLDRTLLALVSQAAPVQVRSRMMGAAFLSPFVAHTLAGMIGASFDAMRPDSFWMLDAGIALAGAVVILSLRKMLTRALA